MTVPYAKNDRQFEIHAVNSSTLGEREVEGQRTAGINS